MNRITLIGRVTRDIELRNSQSGVPMARFSLAVNRMKKDEVDFINCLAFNKTAEVLANYVKKGHRVGVTGSLQTGRYEKDGITHYTADVVCDQVDLIEPKGSGEAPTNPAPAFQEVAAADDAELPF